jgi:FAD/FMN-containing dehydrogenase
MAAMQAHAVGIQLADENLGKRPALFMKDENLARLDTVRNEYDPQALFRSWMTRRDR